jgi:hypothetical protein
MWWKGIKLAPKIRMTNMDHFLSLCPRIQGSTSEEVLFKYCTRARHNVFENFKLVMPQGLYDVNTFTSSFLPEKFSVVCNSVVLDTLGTTKPRVVKCSIFGTFESNPPMG